MKVVRRIHKLRICGVVVVDRRSLARIDNACFVIEAYVVSDDCRAYATKRNTRPSVTVDRVIVDARINRTVVNLNPRGPIVIDQVVVHSIARPAGDDHARLSTPAVTLPLMKPVIVNAAVADGI